MTFIIRTVVVVFLVFRFAAISAQHSGSTGNKVYGYDPLLFNGRNYTFFLPLNTIGNQYFSGPEFKPGSVTIRGVTYTGLSLNFDIYNQQLIMQYRNNMGANSLIIISEAWLEYFSFNGCNFEIISSSDTLKRIFQVLGTGPCRILYWWQKELNLESFQGSRNHQFSDAQREMNIYCDDKILKYRNNRSFCSLFAPEKKGALKEYLHRNKIRVRKAGDQTMTGVISFCNSLNTK